MQTKKQELWVGIDVSMKNFHAALDFPMLFSGQQKISASDLPNREFKLTSAGVRSFLNWIQLQQSDFFAQYSDDEQDNLPVAFLMEATGLCSTTLKKMLYAAAPGSKVIVANPEPIKAFRISLNIKNKTDKSDAQVIARYGRERSPESKPEMPAEMIKLRELARTRLFLKDQRTAIDNHHDNIDSSLPKRMCTAVVKAINKEIDGLEKLIGAFYKIPLKMIIGDQGYGYFITAYDVYNVLLLISTAGLPVAMSRLISQASALGNQNQVRKVYRTARAIFLGLALIFVIGVVFSSLRESVEPS